MRASLKKKPEQRLMNIARIRTLVVGVVQLLKLIGGHGNRATVKTVSTDN
tara:strand:+ start:348 stop:497 length:150 start_codon:yes stop_codon:yes gene_type:complete